MNPISAILFDMDGVLFNSEPLHAQAWVDALDESGYETSLEGLEPWAGVIDIEIAEYMHRHHVSASEERLLELKNGAYDRLIETTDMRCPGVAEGLARLQQTDLNLAVVTSTMRSQARAMLTRGEIIHAFDRIITRDDVERPKPDPEPYRLAAEQLGVEPAACFVIEDSTAGIRAGCEAGCRVLAVEPPFGTSDTGPAHRVFPDTAAAIAWIEEQRINTKVRAN